MDIEQLEALALSDDRSAAIAHLVPGSEDHDYWRAIGLQHRGALEEVDALLATWRGRHGDSEARRRLQRRQRVLAAGGDLARHGDALASELGVSFTHQPEVEAAATRYPTAVDPTLHDEAALVAQALDRGHGLDELTLDGVRALAPARLDPSRRRQWLQRVNRGGLPGLVAVIADDLAERSSLGFGSLPVHGLLTAAELDELARARPTLATDPAWVAARLTRLRPPEHVDWSDDLAARIAYLDALIAAVAPLPPVYAPLRALVLGHRLLCDLRAGQLVRDRLRAYLMLPRTGAGASRAVTVRFERTELVALDHRLLTATALPALGDDSELVRAYVHGLLADDRDLELGDVIDPVWLTQARAEAALVAGDDDPRWAGLLGADVAVALRERVDLELPPTNPTRWSRDGEVGLDVIVKHVPVLRVRVFRVDTAAWFEANGTDVDLSIDLDGLAAGWEQVIERPQPAIVRERVRLPLPACAQPGTYLVELIGGGRASRALVRRGDLRAVTRPTASGLAVAIVDERGQACPQASLWMGGRTYAAGADGAIALPFSTRPGSTPVLLVDGDVATVAAIALRGESYGFAASWLLDRQSLIPGTEAQALVRIDLTIGGTPASLAVLEEPYVEIATTDRRGVTAKQRLPLAVADDRDAEVAFAVPAHAASVALAVGARVRVLSEQRTLELRDDRTISVGAMHAGDTTAALHLRPGADGLRLALLGKSGEPRAGRVVSLSLTSRVVTWTIDLLVATDAQGEIALGALAGVTGFTASAGDLQQRFELAAPAPITASWIAVAAGDEVVLPVTSARDGGRLSPTSWALLEVRGDAPARDCASLVTVEPGRLRVRGLSPGRYHAVLGDERRQLIVVPAAAPRAHGCVALPWGLVELTAAPPPTAAVATRADGALVITVDDATPRTRVHVVATALATTPAFDPRLPASLRAGAYATGELGRARYHAGRDIGDEYRYVLDRQRAPRRAGLLLDKPSLLLNPWALRATSTATQDARGGGPMPPPSPSPAMASAGYAASRVAQTSVGGSDPSFVAHDFLAAPPIVRANLRPGADGTITIAAADLAAATHVHVVVVDPAATTVHRVERSATPLAVRDLRLAAPMPLDQHVREDRRLAALPAGAAIAVLDRATSRLELVDTVDKLYRALCALSGDATLASWDFVPRWASLPEAERLTLYARHACHELALFIHGKDRPLFDRALRPYLAAKLHKTFVDRWLLDDDLREYLEPWRLARLNALEVALLARRHPERAAALHRRLADAVELIAPDPGADDRLVDTIVAGGALGGDSFGDELSAVAADDAPMAGMMLGEAQFGGPSAERAAPPKAAKKRAARREAEESVDHDDEMPMERRKREAAAPLYRSVERTQEWAEHNWYQRRVEDVGPELVAAARLWRDLAAHRDGRFLSPHVVDAAAGLSAAMAALALIELPFAAAAHAITADGLGATVRAGSDAIAAVVEVAPVAGPPNQQILIGQSYFRADDRWAWDGAEQIEKYVTGELLIGVVYACQIVVTNPTSRTQVLAVLHQIPVGAIAVGGAIATATTRTRLEPYQSTTVEYRFYFPHAGGFDHYGAQVTRAAGAEPTLLAAVPPRRLTVVAEPTEHDATSWPHLAQRGSLDEVCAFLARENLGRVDLSQAAWRCRDRAAFTRLTDTLAARSAFDATLWSYALAHRDRARAAEWLAALGADLGDVGPVLASPLLVWEPVERASYQHLEYAPLVNARAHRLGDRRTILNDGLAAQWRRFLEQLAHRATPRAEDHLAAAHYLFAMDRPDDALVQLARGDDPRAGVDVQRAYLAAFGALVAGDLAAAGARIAPYLAHPVDRWRSRFTALAALLADAAGTPPATDAPVADRDNREQVLAAAARATPTLAVRVDGDAVVLEHVAVTAVELRYYRMELELLFSRQPFFGTDKSRFGFIAPGHVDAVPLAAGATTRWPLPTALRRHSLVIEAVAAGARATTTHFAHELAIAVTVPYGRLTVRHGATGAARVAAYVKCYARLRGGAVQFYKDGYTDLAGCFDYATLSTDTLDRVERFALLVVDDHAGATVLEAAPPQR